ncbi:hypothetical protein DAPPUDRAFT_312323 [Daphnia pulex]|uniref:Peptidase C1A papain C-terminal domain-containing protein n=1 Tax=Daphnia pulex TaxID=6669 RepID=E9G0G7_DAPPU|nr:hypothetical protein DAPPUDRAFT_312323 [Daphnia pulex]|eukprot:EFX87406.1 hypothetical protein DAPPUDRAFT_312323 [Daphnia pulex]
MAVSVVKGYSDEDAWRDYKKKYKLDYNIAGDNGKRDRARKKNFLAQMEQIKRHNSKKDNGFFQELNEFSVLRPWEKKRFLGVNASMVPSAEFLKSIPVFDLQSRQLPPSLDYRFHSCLPAIRRQGQCGSCWAFTAITPLEFSKCNITKSPVMLSEQHLVDCDTSNNGCNGGWYMDAWNYLKSKSGSAKRQLYTYTARKGACKFKSSMVGAQVSTYGYVQSKNTAAMQSALQQYGPLAVAINVINSFFSYGGGVYDDPACDGPDVNHAVVLVGWGNLNGVDFWVVRNSWGTGWGLSGYGRILRGVNRCNIESYPAFVKAA